MISVENFLNIVRFNRKLDLSPEHILILLNHENKKEIAKVFVELIRNHHVENPEFIFKMTGIWDQVEDEGYKKHLLITVRFCFITSPDKRLEEWYEAHK